MQYYRLFLLICCLIAFRLSEASQLSNLEDNVSDVSSSELPSSVLPFLPVHVRGHQVATEFASQTDLINIITWEEEPVGPPPSAFHVYRDRELKKLAAIISPNRKLKFKDHNRKSHHTYTYFITAIDQLGLESPPIGIIFKGSKVRQLKVPVSIVIVPITPSLLIGFDQQFATIVIFSDGSVQNLTDVSWSSSDPSVASIDSNGIVTGLNLGTTNISASFGGLTAIQGLNIISSCETPTILTKTLPTGVENRSYSAEIATTGSSPKTYSIVAGSLPSGLTLNSTTGVISGTILFNGISFISRFTVEVTNSCGSATQDLSITVFS